MKQTEDIFNSDHQFDVLLRHALLDKEKMFNEKNLEAMANHIFTQADAETISVADNHSIVEKLVRDFTPKRNYRLNIFLIGLLTTTTIFAVVFFSSKNKKAIPISATLNITLKKNVVTETNPVISTKEIMENPIPQTSPFIVALLDSTRKDELISNVNNGIVSTPSNFTTMHIPEDLSLHYEDIPTLTDDQKKQTSKDKLKILKEVGKKRIYTDMPAGSTNVNGVFTKVNGFGIKDAEITNFEYRTFLNDLLVQGKFDDYLIAKPIDGGWKALGIGEFENLYFENEKYNTFPAANMTRKGAEMYCAWMTNSMKDAITKKEIKWSGTKMPVFRLPNNVEWIYAARAGDTAISHPWSKYTPYPVQNSRGCYLCDFNYSISKDKLQQEGPQMDKNNNKGCIAAKMSTRGVVTTAGRSIDTLVSCPVYSYNPNNSGLYCTIGNVSEMVWTYDAANPSVQGEARSMGGSWFSHVDNAMIEAPEQYVGVTDARAYIGFRIVIVLE